VRRAAPRARARPGRGGLRDRARCGSRVPPARRPPP
jgi:hypothetical protein